MKICPQCALQFPVQLGRCPLDGSALEWLEHADLSLSSAIFQQRYRLTDVVAVDGFSSSFLAVHELLKRNFLVQFYSLSPFTPAVGQLVSENIVHVMRSVGEIKHKYLPRIVDLGFLPDAVYVVSDAPVGELLCMKNPASSGLELENVFVLMEQLCGVVAECHRGGVVHGGISSRSLLFSRNGDLPQITLLDLGLIAALEPLRKDGLLPSEIEQQIYKTIPQQLFGQTIEGERQIDRTNSLIEITNDVFALGSVLHELLTGRQLTAFRAEYLSGQVPAGLNSALADVISRATEADRQKRQQTVAEFFVELKVASTSSEPFIEQRQMLELQEIELQEMVLTAVDEQVPEGELPEGSIAVDPVAEDPVAAQLAAEPITEEQTEPFADLSPVAENLSIEQQSANLPQMLQSMPWTEMLIDTADACHQVDLIAEAIAESMAEGHQDDPNYRQSEIAEEQQEQIVIEVELGTNDELEIIEPESQPEIGPEFELLAEDEADREEVLEAELDTEVAAEQIVEQEYSLELIVPARPSLSAALAMLQIEGEVTLTDVFKQHSPLSPDEVLEILRAITLQLAEANGAGIVHSDIKPDNLLLSVGPSGELVARLVNFLGVIPESPEVDSLAPEAIPKIVGTPQFMSPEQIRAYPLDATTDIYSLGVVMYLALNGNLPFSANSLTEVFVKHLTEPPPPAFGTESKLPLETKVAIEAVLQQSLAKESSARYRDVVELLEAFEEAVFPTAPELDFAWPSLENDQELFAPLDEEIEVVESFADSDGYDKRKALIFGSAFVLLPLLLLLGYYNPGGWQLSLVGPVEIHNVLPQFFTVEQLVILSQRDIELQNFAAAKRRLEEALRKYPQTDSVHYSWGLLELAQGHQERAFAAFLSALRINPENVEAREQIAIITKQREEVVNKRNVAQATESVKQMKLGGENIEGHFHQLKLLGLAAVPSLIELLDDPDKRLRIRAMFALAELGTKDAAGRLLLALDDSDGSISKAASIALSKMELKTFLGAIQVSQSAELLVGPIK